MKFSQAQLTLSLPWREDGCAQQSNKDDRQIKATVEQILHLSQVTMPVLCEVKRMVRPIDGSLEVAQHRVDRLELRQLDTVDTAAGDDSFMLDAHRLHSNKALQSIGDHATLGPSDAVWQSPPSQPW